ncbi:MAG: glutamate synthase large subunit [Deltaproteobacteria bacterium]|jgi:glutamate synthase domain-containing protein 2/glutamate synthase domain-containing protein 1/glutamate synthase domain-containing protein 3|nr:glutamate synthase large subunit [Deltaproteobacteria bacterium]
MEKIGLYDPANEHDSCGVGCVVRLDGQSNHEVVALGLKLVVNMTHRGAAGADADSGDGAGILLRIPDAFLRKFFGPDLPEAGRWGLGMIFLPREEGASSRCRELVENQAEALGWRLAGWREVPIEPSALGRMAAETMPSVWQFAAVSPLRPGEDEEGLERRLYVLRKSIERKALSVGLSQDAFYIPSLSCRTVVYKGMMMAAQVARFYPDLVNEEVVTPLAVVHQRYSTNTFPSWRLAQPFRELAHNGEINTIKGNRAWLAAREPNLGSPLFGDDIKKLFPLIEPDSSDSASIDNGLEFLRRGGRSLEHALTMLIPQAWGQKYPMSLNLRGFFEYHAGLMEPWDGPATVVVSDGLSVAAALDRNGLRPARYTLADNGLLVFASESGALELESHRIIDKGSLRPGQMILAEVGSGRLLKNAEVKSILARQRPYRRWVSENRIDIPGFFTMPTRFTKSLEDLPFRQTLFGYNRDDTEILLTPMASNGVEPNGSMGADIPLAVLDQKPQSLFSFFRQQFAQITNPPIDPIREELVMSLMTFIGYDPNILSEEPRQARLVKLAHPFLSNDDLGRLRDLKYDDFHSVTIDSIFPKPDKGAPVGASLAAALNKLEAAAEEAAQGGTHIIIVSDKKAGAWSQGKSPEGKAFLPIPSLLAVAAVNRKLVEIGKRVSIGVVCQTGDALEVSHMAMLLSLGASAINPWLAFETVADLAAKGHLNAIMSPTTAVENYVMALRKGLLKIMSKMGISTLRGYRGAQIFEAVGLGPDLMEKYFPDIPSMIGGLGLPHIEAGAVQRAENAEAYLPADDDRGPRILPQGGTYRFRKSGQPHLWTSESVTTLRQAVVKGDYGLYKRYASMINDQSHRAFTLRGQLEFKPGPPIPLEDVEPVSEIVKRFCTGAMSFGSLSKEAHETMALAMNRLGARSNCGEGGEDPIRYKPRPDGLSTVSAIKQVASGRFGVTTEYLAHAKELQIKIAQGAKPGEGGQLPGHKVDTEIGRVRHSTPGVTLISPPPHHDIYSIEDIAQLIYDLHQAADQATVSVKLVSVVGVGTIAAGVSKAMAESILISGFDGGTGASPLSSIRHAGSPWEVGLAETQQTLVLNNLRTRVRLQVDGQMKTGRDVAVAALLGADEYGFATAVLVSMGCLMMRKCHTNTCPVGVATQDPAMRARFKATPEEVMNYFTFVAMELREIMAFMGFRTVNEMIGQCDRLEPKKDSPILADRSIDYSKILFKPQSSELRYLKYAPKPPADTLDDRLLPRLAESIETGKPITISEPVKNTDRTIGAKISSRIVRKYGLAGLPDGTITLRMEGIAGQSFGAFAARGLTLDITGEVNDYVGKGLSGGRLIIRPPRDIHPDFVPELNTIAGNVVLYGATSGELYMNGLAGERFGVRNSGALAVVEGVGDHGCEYMTGGRVVVLGKTGVNFAAGMSGGLAYVYDADGFFDNHCNLEMVDLDLLDRDDEIELRILISRHAAFTNSAVAKKILADWGQARTRFVKVFPMEYRQGIALEARRLQGIPMVEMVTNGIESSVSVA